MAVCYSFHCHAQIDILAKGSNLLYLASWAKISINVAALS